MSAKQPASAIAAEQTLALPPRTAHAVLAMYYQVTKPGIVYSNAMTAASGFLFAARWHANLLVMLALLAGNALIIASACVTNNYIDRRIDRMMVRTKKRGTANGMITARNALLFAALLAALGFGLLSRTNLLTVLLGGVAWLAYVVLYGLAKRRTPHGTLVGTLSGGASLVAGYTAVTTRLDLAAMLLFLVMLTWQMAHFYSIAIFRLADYKAAGLPVWPARFGVPSTMRYIMAYVLMFAVTNILLVACRLEGYAYLVIMVTLSGCWLWSGWRGWHVADKAKWARGMFGRSLVVLLVFAIALPSGRLLP